LLDDGAGPDSTFFGIGVQELRLWGPQSPGCVQEALYRFIHLYESA
jgi:hypothetical protein